MLSLRYHLLCKCGMQILEVHVEVFPICLCFRIRSHTIRSPLPLMENCCGKCVCICLREKRICLIGSAINTLV